jgi:hypothetical protein
MTPKPWFYWVPRAAARRQSSAAVIAISTNMTG